MNNHPLLRIGFAAGLCTLTALAALAQNGEEEAIKKTIGAETEAFYKSDPEGWAATWVHEPNATRTFVSKEGYSGTIGWEKFGPETMKGLKQQQPIRLDVKSENYIIRTDGNLAWVEYDQYMSVPGGDPNEKRLSREYRVLTKQNGEWKIATQITHDPETFKPSAQSAEISINAAGYQFIAAKKVKGAIEILKLNVKLNPNSWNVYDSLGEAYALNGDKRQAIKNYEKSIALNPKNENGKAALAKLKNKQRPA